MVNREKNASSWSEYSKIYIHVHDTGQPDTVPSSWKYARIKEIRMEFLWIDSTNANCVCVCVCGNFSVSVFFSVQEISLMLDKATLESLRHLFIHERKRINGFEFGFWSHLSQNSQFISRIESIFWRTFYLLSIPFACLCYLSIICRLLDVIHEYRKEIIYIILVRRPPNIGVHKHKHTHTHKTDTIAPKGISNHVCDMDRAKFMTHNIKR